MSLRGTTLIPRVVTQRALLASNKAVTCNGVSRPALLNSKLQTGGSGASIHTVLRAGSHQPPVL